MSDTENTLNGGHVCDSGADYAFPDGKLNEMLPVLLGDEEVTTLPKTQNVDAVARKGHNDHGPKRIGIVLSHALRLYDLFKADGCEFNGVVERRFDEVDESIIIALATQLHDIGHIIHHDNHAYYSIPLASDVLDRFPPEFYGLADAVYIRAEVLHAVLCHHREKDPLTLEASVIRVADALNMKRGRSCIPYEKESRGINILSGRAIKDVVFKPGEESAAPVEIEILNTAGVCRVDNPLKAKLNGSSLEDHVHIIAVSTKPDNRLVERVEL